MSKYNVSIPIAGSIAFQVEASSEKEAIEIAFQTDIEEGDVEWEMYETLCQGNVLSPRQNKIEISIEK